MRLASLLVGCALLVASTGASQGGTITTTATYASAPLPTTGVNTSLTVNRFNPAGLGKLLSVEIELDATAGGTLRVNRSNTGPAGSILYSGIIGADFTLTFNATSLPVLDLEALATVNAPRNANTTGQAVSDTDSVSNIFVSPGMLAFFTGPGSVNLALNIVRENATDISPAQGVNGAFRSFAFGNVAGASVTVTYVYIPEPMTLSLFGLGLLGLGVARRVTRRA